jgi:hypothetical protein
MQGLLVMSSLAASVVMFQNTEEEFERKHAQVQDENFWS